MKSILFTNLSFASRTGSELHVLELAQKYRERGWEVTCYTVLAGYPLLSEANEIGMKVVALGEEDSLARHYDVLFAQHHIVSDYLWSNFGIFFDKVIVSLLGFVSEQEKIPDLASCANLVVFVSEEARSAFRSETEELSLPTLVFPNYASRDFFTPNNHVFPKETPKAIAVISNHPPQKL